MFKKILLFALLVCVLGCQRGIISPKITPGALKMGVMAPDFQAMGRNGDTVRLSRLLMKGPVVIVFYRGEWCPICSKHLSKLQDSLGLVLEKGASVLAITPESGIYIDKTVAKTNANFPILFDRGHKIMDAYGVSFVLDDSKAKSYKLFLGAEFEKAHENTENILPVPATYVVGKDGKIKFVHFDEDYKKRASVREILGSL